MTLLVRTAASVSNIGRVSYQSLRQRVTRESKRIDGHSVEFGSSNLHSNRHPEEPQCSYDPIEGLTLADSVNPAEKIRQLEEQIGTAFPTLRHSIAL